MFKFRLLMAYILVTMLSLPSQADETSSLLQQLPKLAKMNQAGLLLVGDKGDPLISKQASQLFVPASTTKLVTAYLALSHWGEAHRFKTDFYLQTEAAKTTLWVKGYGDPFLISEELTRVADQLNKKLQALGVTQIDQINLDTSWFAQGLTLPGTSQSDNPYDAVPSSIAANFNTLFLYRQDGKVRSAEAQTPLTPLALELGKGLGDKKQRVNTGADPKVSQRYFAELLVAFLRQQGLSVSPNVKWKKLVDNQTLLYQHINRHTLAEIIKPMMKYSTNFIANQLVLMMAAETYGAPVTADKVKAFLKQRLAQHFDWSGAVIEEGAGLSRNNRLSSQQLIELLQAFKPWKHLLPEVEDRVFAKSGSLIGVSTLAGYIQKDSDWLPFALMMNQKTPYRYRNKVARQLSLEINKK